MSIETKLNKKGNASSGLLDFAAAILPVFRKTDDRYIENQVEQLIKEHPEAANYRDSLAEDIKNIYAEPIRPYNGYQPAFGHHQITVADLLTYARVADSWDRIATGIEAVLAAFSLGGSELIMMPEIIESAPKYALIPLVWHEFGFEYGAILTGAETGSLLPGIGEAVDVANIYVNTVEKAIRDRLVERYRANKP